MMLDLTNSIEAREEEYLYSMADRFGKTPPEPPPSTFATFLSTVLQRFCLIMALLMVLALGGVYRLQSSHEYHLHVHHDLFVMAYGAAGTVVVANIVGWTAVRLQNDLALKLFVLLLGLVLISAAVLCQQVTTIESSQSKLLKVMLRNNATDATVSDEDKEFVLNGGLNPSLAARFIFDAPGWFLRWMHQQCASSHSEDTDDSRGGSSSSGSNFTEIRINSDAFFDSLWNQHEQSCVLTTLRRNLTIDLMAQVLLGSCITAVCIQASLSAVIMLFKQPTARPRKRSKVKTPVVSHKPRSHIPFYLMRMLMMILALIGGTATLISAKSLQSCDFSHATEWVFAGILAFGLVVLLSVLFVSCQWKPLVAILLVLLCLGAEMWGSVLLGHVRVGLSDLSSSQTIRRLRDLYQIVSTQTCSPVQQWLADICIADGNMTLASNNVSSQSVINDAGFDLSCEVEFGTLVSESLAFSGHVLQLLLWSDLLLLIIMLLPLLRRIANAFTKCFWRLLVPSSMLPETGFEIPVGWSAASLSLSFEEARDTYLESVKSTDEVVRDTETQAFDSHWKAMKGCKATDSIANEGTMIFQYEFEAIVRLLAIRRLTIKCKLDVSLTISNDGLTLFLLIHASDNLLMMTLCQMDYKLQFAEYIDPGRLFWRDPKEIDMDERILEAADVKQKFRLLLLNKIVSHKEAMQFPTESLSRVSARIQALLRSSRMAEGTLKCSNMHLAYAAYQPATNLNFVYKKYPNRLDVPNGSRRSMVLRTVDCIRITQHIIETEFAVDAMKQADMISSFYCLHNASRFDFNSRDTLSSAWVTFWRPAYHEGEFDPETHWWLNKICRFYPFRQPLRDVRDYFGECIAFYFAWVAFYSELLMVPALSVVLILLLSSNDIDLMPFVAFYRSDAPEGSPSPFKSISISTSAFSLGFGVIVWGFVFAKWWERKTVWFELQWRTTGLGLDVKDRANFRGEKVVNPITQEVEISFSSTQQLQRQISSSVCVFALSCVHLLLSITLLLLQGYLAQWIDVSWSMLVCCGCLSIMIQWNGAIISSVAHALSGWENYQNEVAFQSSVIVKIFFMQCVNTYGGLLLLAFSNLGALRHTVFKALVDPYLQYLGSISVIVQMEILLTLIFVVRIAAHLLTILQRVARKHTVAAPSAKPAAAKVKKAKQPPRHLSAQEEHELPEYGGAYEDYTEIVVQFGLVVMFSSILPLAPLFAFVESALEMRLDAINLCFFLQRPQPEFAEGIGLWSSCIRVLLKMALFTNFGFVYFTAANHQDWAFVERTSSFLLAVLTCLLVSEILWFAVPSTSRHAREVQARNEFLVGRYFGDYDEPGSSGSSTEETEWNADMNEQDDTQSRDPTGSVQESLEHSYERYELLRRLNVALRTHDTSSETPTIVEEPAVVTRNSDDDLPDDEYEIAEVREVEDEEEQEQVFVYQSTRYLRSRHEDEAKQKHTADEIEPSDAVLAFPVAVDVDNFNIALAQELEQSLPVEVASEALLEMKRAPTQSSVTSSDQERVIPLMEVVPVIENAGDELSVSEPDQMELRAHQSDVSSELSNASDRRLSRRPSFLSAFKSKRDGSADKRTSSPRASSFGFSSKPSSPSTMSKLFGRRASRDLIPKQDTPEVPQTDEQLSTELPLPNISPPAPPVPEAVAPVVSASKRYSRTSLTGREAIREATQRSQFDFANDGGSGDASIHSFVPRADNVDVEWSEEPPKAAQKVEEPPKVVRKSLFSSRSKTTIPATVPIAVPRSSIPHTKLELSGIEAVHEATRRSSQFNFSDN